MMPEDGHDWILAARTRGWGDILRAAIDALEPLGPLGAQLIWVSQPLLGLVVGRGLLAGLAAALETPDELAALRETLDQPLDTSGRG